MIKLVESVQVVVGGTGANEGILVGEADGYLEGTVVGKDVGKIETVGDRDGE